jgi:hypothetical protein
MSRVSPPGVPAGSSISVPSKAPTEVSARHHMSTAEAPAKVSSARREVTPAAPTKVSATTTATTDVPTAAATTTTTAATAVTSGCIGYQRSAGRDDSREQHTPKSRASHLGHHGSSLRRRVSFRHARGTAILDELNALHSVSFKVRNANPSPITEAYMALC